MTFWNANLVLEHCPSQPNNRHYTERAEVEAKKCHTRFQVHKSRVEVYLRCPNKSAKIWETRFGLRVSSGDFHSVVVGSSAQDSETVLVLLIPSLQQSKPRF